MRAARTLQRVGAAFIASMLLSGIGGVNGFFISHRRNQEA